MNGYHVFSATIYKVGVIRFVDVPAQVSRSLGSGTAHVPVSGEIEKVPVRSTLVPRGKGCYRLAVHSDIRNKLKLDAGDIVEVAIQVDEEPREPILPPALVLALRNAPKAQAAFREMTTALRRQVVRYLISVKHQSTLERRVTAFVRRLESRAMEKPQKKNKPRKKQ